MIVVARLIDLYSLILLGAVIVSWVRLPPHNPVVRVLGALTEPLLKPIRRVLPTTAGLDWSPMVVMLGLQLLKRALFGF